MRKIYRIGFLILILIFLSTYSTRNTNTKVVENSDFFKINKVIITNNLLVKKTIVIERLEDLYKKNIFSIKSEDIERSLEGIDFLKKIEIKKKYPNTLIIKIVETKPIAIIFKGKTKFFLDNFSCNFCRCWFQTR